MINILKQCQLFAHVDDKDIYPLLNCLSAKRQRYAKGDFIVLADETAPMLSVMLSGKAQIIKENVLGDSMIIGAVEASDLFGETFACMDLPFIPVSVIALEDCEVLQLDINHVVRTCPTSCPFHQQMIFNLLQVMAEKNMFLNKKMSYLTHKTIRSRLEAYFIDCMEQQHSPSFTIAFNRNELAEYLCADRSALSRELAKMQQQDLIDYNGRKFTWKEKALKPKG